MRTCRIHNVPLNYGRAEIRRGYPPAPPEGYFDAEENLFPLARTFELGGCVVDSDDKDEKRVRYCSVCREAQTKWLEGREVEDFWQA